MAGTLPATTDPTMNAKAPTGTSAARAVTRRGQDNIRGAQAGGRLGLRKANNNKPAAMMPPPIPPTTSHGTNKPALPTGRRAWAPATAGRGTSVTLAAGAAVGGAAAGRGVGITGAGVGAC